MWFGVLGPLEVRSDAGTILTVPRRKSRVLLSTLVLRPNCPLSVEHLVDVVWGDRPPASAVANLQSYVADVRRLLGAQSHRLATADRSYVLNVEPDEVDWLRFEAGLDRAGTARRAGDPALAADHLTRALGLWRGEQLAEGLELPAALQADADRLNELRLTALEDSYELRLDLGRHLGLAAELTTLTTRHPLRERLWAQLMRALYASGRQAEALRAFHQVRTRLDDELGVDPGPELRHLHERILLGDPHVAGGSTTASVGEAVPVPRQLPPEIFAFTGRATEIGDVVDALRRRPAAVVAVDGMGGIGKTALAVQVGHHVADDYPDGQLFVDLRGFAADTAPAAVTDVLADMLRAVGYKADALPVTVSERSALWRSVAAERRLLIVLDNAASSAQVQPLLPAAPGCAVVITSRRRLGLDTAEPTSLDALPEAECAALFREVAGPGHSDAPDDTVSVITALCGSLPLAVRIAAGRLRARPAWTAADLAARLRDASRRLGELQDLDRGVATAFRLSYEQLSPADSRLFRLLSVHPGPDLNAAAAAALVGGSAAAADQALQRLVDDHLLQEHRAGRFRLHDLLRDFSAELAGRDDEERVAAVRRLLDWYLAAAFGAAALLDPERAQRPPMSDVRVESTVSVTDSDEAVSMLEAERRSLVALVRLALHSDNLRHAAMLAVALFPFYYLRGYNDDFIATLELAAVAAGRIGDPVIEAEVLGSLPAAFGRAQRYEEAARPARRALELWLELGSRSGEARARNNLAVLAWISGDLEESDRQFQVAFSMMRELGDKRGEARVSNNLGEVARRVGRIDDAIGRYTRAIELFGAFGNHRGLANTLANRAAVRAFVGEWDAARADVLHAQRICDQIGHREGAVGVLNVRGMLHVAEGRPEEAAQCQSAALAQSRELGDPMLELQSLNGLGEALEAAGDPAALPTFQAAVDLLMPGTGQLEAARAHRGLGRALLADGRRDTARAQLALAAAAYEVMGRPEAIELRGLSRRIDRQA